MKFFILFFAIFILFLNIREDNFLSKKDTTYLKGILQIFIMLHHISQNENNISFLNYFSNFGMYSVGVFFFISIYGLGKQITKNKEKYLKSFLKNRFLKIFLSVFIFTLITLLTRIIILNESWSLIEILNLYKKGSSLIVNGWYLNSILIIYLLFYVSFKFLKNTKNSYILFSFSLIFYIFILKNLNFGIWWYNSMITLIFGVIFINFEEKIILFFKKYFKIIFSLSIFSFYILEKYGYRILEKFNLPISYAFFQNLMCLNFCIMILLIFKKIKLKSKVLEFLGNISFEMYMIHGLIMKTLNMYLKTNYLYIFLTFTFTIFLSFLLNKSLKKFYSLCKI